MKTQYSRYRLNLRALFFSVIITVLYNSLFLFAQVENEPFSSIKLEAKVSHNINNNILDIYWNSIYGAEFLVELPFYSGDVQAGFLLQRYNSNDTKYPDFTGNFLFIGLGGNLKLPLKFELFGGIKAGYFLMTYDSDTLTAYEKFESELMAGVNFRITYPVTEHVYLSVSSDLLVLMTHERLKLYNISAGAAYKFSSPKWIKDIFN